jgi:hypothetical protein
MLQCCFLRLLRDVLRRSFHPCCIISWGCGYLYTPLHLFMHIGAISVKKCSWIVSWWNGGNLTECGLEVMVLHILQIMLCNLQICVFFILNFMFLLSLIFLGISSSYFQFFFPFLFFVPSWIWSCFLFYVPDSRTINFNCIGLFYDLPLFVFYDSLYLTSYKYVSIFFFFSFYSHYKPQCHPLYCYGGFWTCCQ